MALSTIDLVRIEDLALDQDDIREILSTAGFKGDALDTLSLDLSQKQANINTVAQGTNSLEIQVAQNVLDISTNADDILINTGNITTNATNISTNTGNITTNATNISTNAGNITTNATNLTNHENLTTAHGATGNNVGTLDFASAGTGGVVLEAVNVSNASVTTTVIATADIGLAPVAYDQTYAQQQTDLINECKSKINSLINSDVLDAITQLNAFLLANQNANQMA